MPRTVPALALLLLAACTMQEQPRPAALSAAAAPPIEAIPAIPYEDVTATALPTASLTGLIMDAKPVDVDGDGDLDLVLAHEFRANILLISNGTGRFTDESAERLPRANHDSEDIGVADFDGDGDPDIIVVSEDDRTNELYFNDGTGFFADEGRRLPVTGVTNGVAVADFDADGDPDVVLANNGQNFALVNDGRGNFSDETAIRLPPIRDISQDVEIL